MPNDVAFDALRALVLTVLPNSPEDLPLVAAFGAFELELEPMVDPKRDDDLVVGLATTSSQTSSIDGTGVKFVVADGSELFGTVVLVVEIVRGACD